MIEVIKDIYTGIISALHTYVDNGWVRQPLILGYSLPLDDGFNTSASATSYAYTSGIVPDDEVWVINNICFRNASNVTSNIISYVVRDSGSYSWLGYISSVVVGEPFVVNDTIILCPGDKVVIYAGSLTVGDTINGGISGFITKKDL